MELANERLYTTDDIYNLPENQRAELIDGQIYMMAPPSRKHQQIIGELFGTIRDYIRSRNGGCRIYVAPLAVFLKKDNKNYVEPDISVICDKDKLTEEGCNGAPDLIIEVVSPSSRKMDYGTKNAMYSNAGVREYWIVDPAKECTTIYRYEQDAAPAIYPFSVPVTCGIFEGLSITVEELLK